MALIDAYKYVQENIDENFPVQSIAYFENERECKIFYEYHNGITVFCDYSVQFEKLQDLKSEQEIIDKEKYGFNYIETTLDKALEVFKLQDKK